MHQLQSEPGTILLYVIIGIVILSLLFKSDWKDFLKVGDPVFVIKDKIKIKAKFVMKTRQNTIIVKLNNSGQMNVHKTLLKPVPNYDYANHVYNY